MEETSKLRPGIRRGKMTIGGSSPTRAGNSANKRKSVKYERLPEEMEFEE